MSSFKRTARIKILDEVNCAVLGLHPDHKELFWNRFARKAPNYYFNPKFKLGAWDGKIRYFHKNGKTYVYLLTQIIPQLKALGYKFHLTDERESGNISVDPIDKNYFSHIEDIETGVPLELRYYQVEAVNALTGGHGGIVIAGTGAGKTIMNGALVDLYGKKGLKTITIVPSQDLTKQTRNVFRHLQLDVGEYSGLDKDISHRHVVSTWQSLQNNPKLMHQFDVVVIDECHGLKGQVLTKLMNDHGNNIRYRFGLTGTLPKAETDALSVHIALGDVVYEIPARQLIDEQYLAKMHIDIFQLSEDFEKQYQEYLEHTTDPKPLTYIQFKDSVFPEWTQEKRYLQQHKPRLEWMANLIEVKRDMKKGNVLCLVNGIDFGKKLTKLIDNARFVYGKDKQKVRKQIYDMFRDENDLVVIANIQIASTGLDISRIFNLMFIDVGKSFIRVIQTIGRGLRRAKDKDYVSVTDVCSDLKYSKRHVRERAAFYREAQYPFKKHVVKYTKDMV